MKNSRRAFLQKSIAAAGLALPLVSAARPRIETAKTILPKPAGTSRFSAIGLNHGHINGLCEALIRNGAELVSFFAKEDDLAAGFSKRYPNAKRASSQKEILDDKSIQLVVSASIPVDRAPLGIEVMKAGKDFMVDKPGITTLEQLAEVR